MNSQLDADDDLAIPSVSSLLRDAPENWESYDWKGLEARMLAVIGKNPYRAQAYKGLGLAQTWIRSREDGAAVFRFGILMCPDAAELHSVLGELYTKMGNWKEAIKFNTSAIELDPQRYEAHISLGYDLYQIGNLSDAVAPLIKGTTLNPSYRYGFLYLGMTYARLEQWENAVVALQQAVRLYSDPEDALEWLVYVYRKVGDRAQAIKLCEELIRLNRHIEKYRAILEELKEPPKATGN